nr:hypothetical protein [Tanacetum cinerariifolium]
GGNGENGNGGNGENGNHGMNYEGLLLPQTLRDPQLEISRVKYKDINQIDEDDIEEIDIKWNMALLSMRADKFLKKTGKKISIQGTDAAGFDKSKVECFNCHKMGHFARECRAPKSQDRGRRENFKQGSKVEESAPKALMAIDGEASTEFASMAKFSSKTKGNSQNNIDDKGRNFKLTDDTNVLFITPRQHNMYSIDLNNVVPHSDLTCLVAKAFANESMLWNKRLGHLNFKTISRLVRHNLVKGLPSKCFDNDHTCVACLKGKQHKASCKTKLVNSVTKSLHTLHMDLFGPTSVSSPNHKWYCLVVTDDFFRFTWTFFLKTKDETSGILRKFITEIENLKDLKVKISRCDNGGEFKNKEINDFCSRKGIKREFSNARTPQQNGVAERRNRTLIEASRTMLADAKLPITFWAEAVNTACYVQNRVLVNKSQNKTPYKLFNGRTPAIGILKPFGCLVMIFNTLDHLGKFEAKEDEGYFIGYSMSSKAFMVFNKRTTRIEENLHVDFLENKLIEKGAGPNWLFDIDTLTNSMNYVPIVFAGTTSTNFSGTKDAASQNVKKDVSSLRYIALPNWFHEAHLDSSTSNAQDACKADAPKSSGNSNSTATSTNPPADQMDTLTVATLIPTVSSPVPTACLDDSPQPSSDTRIISKRVTSQDDTPSLDNILTLSNRFKDILGVTTNTGDTNGVEADLSNIENNISASPTPTFRIHKDHPTSQIIGPVDTPVQTRTKSKEMEEQGFIASIHHIKNPDLLQFCLFSCFLSQEKPTKIFDALKDLRVRPIGTKCVLKNKKDERGIVIRNKARLVAQGHTQEEGIDYEEVFVPVARIEAIRLFLAYASFMGFTVYQMDVKSAFLYGTIDEEVYMMQPHGFQDPEFPARVYKVEKAMYGLHQAPRAWYGTLSKYLLTNGFQRGTIDQTVFIRKHIGYFILVQVYVDDIIFGSSNPQLCKEFEALMHEKFQMSAMGELNFFLGLSANTPMEKENPWGKDGTGKDVDLHLYRSMIGSLMYLTASRPDIMFAVYNDYGGASQDRKLTTRGCQFLGRRLILWQCKKQTIVATLTTEAEYVAAASGCGQVLWIQNQLLDYRRARIAQSSALPTAADEPASPLGDDSQGEACPTISGLEAVNDRANIIKSSTLPHDLPPRVTFLVADEGSMQHKLNELMDLCTRLQRQQTEMASKIAAQDLEIASLKARIKLLEDKYGEGAEPSGEDATIKGRNLETWEEAGVDKSIEIGSNDTEELVNVLTSLNATNILTSGGVQVVSVPLAAKVSTVSVPTASPIFTTASVVTPYSRRKGKENMVESDTPKKKKLQEQIDVQVAREMEEQIAREDQRINEQIARDAKIARIHVEEELQILIDSLDRNNETSQQIKPLSKKQQREFYMSVLKSHAGWKTKHFKGMTLEEIREKFIHVWKQIEDFVPIGSKEEGERFKRKWLRLKQDSAKKVKTSEEVSEEDLKTMIQLVPVEEVYVEALQVKHPIIDWEIYTVGQRTYWKIIRLGGNTTVYQFFVDMLKHFNREDLNQLWTLVKETISIKQATSDKEKEL